MSKLQELCPSNRQADPRPAGKSRPLPSSPSAILVYYQSPAVASAICSTASGKAILRAPSRSFTEKCKPMPNISSTTRFRELPRDLGIGGRA